MIERLQRGPDVSREHGIEESLVLGTDIPDELRPGNDHRADGAIALSVVEQVSGKLDLPPRSGGSKQRHVELPMKALPQLCVWPRAGGNRDAGHRVIARDDF